MLTIDLSPHYHSFIGLDRLAEACDIAARMAPAGDPYPPYDIEKTGDDGYRITMAVPGFADSDLKVEVQDRTLFVAGQPQAADDRVAETRLHEGLARRPFARRFRLADHVEVTAARLSDGLLSIELVHKLPERVHPRRIAIESGGSRAAAGPPLRVIEGRGTKAA